VRRGRDLFAAVVLLATSAKADEATIAAGRAIVAHGVSPERPGCASCHLQNGAGQADVGIPRLAGLSASYIAEQLGYFALGLRHDTAMAPYAAALSSRERQAVADYFASLPVPEPPDPPPTRSTQPQRGRALFLDGDYRTGLISCSQCHGQTGLGVGDFSPRLAGQSAAYVAEKLRQWRSGEPRDPKGAFMRAEASHLSQSDIDAVAAYVASLGRGSGSRP
jgi:cytochrome c553